MTAHMLIIFGVALFTSLVGCGSPETPSQSPRRTDAQRATDQNSLIAYSIAQSSEFGAAKASFDVRVDLVNGRLPTEAELVAISQHLKESAGPHDRTFVVFYLPGMVVDSGGYATAHHNPDCEFRLLRFNLPKRYAALLPPEDLPVQEPVSTSQNTGPIDVSFDFTVEWQGGRPVIVGQTNLPDGTQIMTSVSREEPPFMAQDQVDVRAGQFRAGPFGPPSGLVPGTYEAGATMPYAQVQPASVKAIIGQKGEKLRGSHIKRDKLFGATMSVDKTFTK